MQPVQALQLIQLAAEVVLSRGDRIANRVRHADELHADSLRDSYFVKTLIRAVDQERMERDLK